MLSTFNSCMLVLLLFSFASAEGACRSRTTRDDEKTAKSAGSNPQSADGESRNAEREALADSQKRAEDEDPFASIPRITVEELREALAEGKALAVDVRPFEAFERERIPGAVSLPEDEVVERGGALPKDVLLVAYCA